MTEMILRDGWDLESSEMLLRREMQRVGGMVLEELLNSDKGYRGVRTPCEKGHQAEFVEYRSKEIVTVLSPVTLDRAYYYCKQCGGGVVPRDQELDVQDTGFSPGVRRMIGHVGGNEAFEAGRRDLEILAGVSVSAKAVERVSEGIGRQLEVANRVERECFVSGKIVSLQSAEKLYVCLDGTGVPVVPKETEGRQGKEKGSVARTREGKLGCVFTQTRLDEKGHPVRDEHSTTYVGAIETAEQFGWRLYGEALRRGLNRASKVIILGDGLMDEADTALVQDLAVLVLGVDDHEPALVIGEMALDQRQGAFADRAEADHHDGPVDTGVNGPSGHCTQPPGAIG